MGTLGWPLSHPPPTTQVSAHPAGVLAEGGPAHGVSQNLGLNPTEGSLPGPGRRGYWRLSWAHIPLTSRHCPEFLYPYLGTLPSCEEW